MGTRVLGRGFQCFRCKKRAMTKTKVTGRGVTRTYYKCRNCGHSVSTVYKFGRKTGKVVDNKKVVFY